MSSFRMLLRRLQLGSASELSRWQCSSRLHRLSFFLPGRGHVLPTIFSQNISTKSSKHTIDSSESSEVTTLPTLSVEQFKQAAKDGRLDPGQVRTLLQSLRKELERIPEFEKRRQRIFQLKPGAHALLWALKLPREKLIKLSGDRDLVALVCYFVVVEGKEDYVLEWLRREAEQDRYSDRWAHHWIANLGQASYDWDPTGSPTTILLFLQKATSIFAQYCAKRSGVMTALLVLLSRILKKAECPVYDASLFECYASALPKFYQPVLAREKIARLMVFHPTQPDAMSVYQSWVRGNLADIWNARPSSVHALAYELLRAAHIFRLQPCHSEADELEMEVQRKSPSVWRNRAKITRECELDPKLNVLRSQAKGKSLASG